ncbi:MAG: efflux RND transporter periplasmic adaptor subunit [Planctomycetaceae bacterium]
MTTRHRIWQLCATLAASLIAGPLLAGEIEGFTEPYRDLDVAATDTGIVSLVNVKEGDQVKKDQVLGSLDQSLLNATLEIADRGRQAQGRLKSATADVRLKSERCEKLKLLFDRKHATQEELDRSFVEKEVSEAQLLAVQEEISVRGLEYDRIKIQLEQRQVRSPIDGVVVKLHRDVGEFVSGNDPVIATVVQLDPLIATYSVPSSLCQQIKEDANIDILIGKDRVPASGVVDYVAPVTDAQSGTVLIKVRVANPQYQYRSGEKCLLIVDGEPQKEETAERPKNGLTPPPSVKPPVKTGRIELKKVQSR